MKAAILVLALCMSCGAAAQEREYREALRLYQSGQWSGAYGRFIVLANNGHRDAARIALFMHQYGEVLYRTQWDASDEDIEHWSRVAGPWRRPGQVERIASAQPATKPAPQPAWRPRMTRFQGRALQQEPRR